MTHSKKLYISLFFILCIATGLGIIGVQNSLNWLKSDIFSGSTSLVSTSTNSHTYEFGEGSSDHAVQKAFQYIAQAMVMPGVPKVYPTSSTYSYYLDQFRAVSIQEVREIIPQFYKTYFAIYNNALQKSFLIDKEYLGKLHTMGLPTSMPTYSVNDFFTQSFEKGILVHKYYTSPETSSAFTTYEDYRKIFPILPGEGIDNLDIKNAFVASVFLHYNNTITPTEKAFPIGEGEYGQKVHTEKGDSLLLFNQETNRSYLMSPMIFKHTTAQERQVFGYPLDDAMITDTLHKQYFSNAVVFYDVATNKVTYVMQHDVHNEAWDNVGAYNVPHKGESATMFVRVRFSDLDYSLAPEDAYYDTMLNSGSGYSMRSYWNTASAGTFHTKAIIATSTLPIAYRDIIKQFPNDYGESNTALMDMVAQHVLKDSSIPWSKADLNGPQGLPDGIVDHVTLALDVHPKQLSALQLEAQPFRAFAYNTRYITNSHTVQDKERTLETGPYSAISLFHNGLSVITHEFGHGLGLIDLYDLDGSSFGVGHYSLMASSHLGFFGAEEKYSLPQMLDAYNRKRLGWAHVVHIKGHEDITLFPSTENNTIYQLGEGNEYFLLENRKKSSFDMFLPDEGLAVYRINELAVNNANEWNPRVALLTSSSQTPLVEYSSTKNLHTTGAILPNPNTTHLSQRRATDTNLINGVQTGIRIERIDTMTNYPEIHVHVYYPGPNNEYSSTTDGTSFQLANVDLDNNGVFNESDHSLLLKEALTARIPLDRLQSIYHSMYYALADQKGIFEMRSNPLAVLDISTIHASAYSLLLSIETNNNAKLHIQSKDLSTGIITSMESEATLSKIPFELTHLTPATSYELSVTAHNSWEESPVFTKTFTTLAIPLVDKKLRSTYYDVYENELLEKNHEQLISCFPVLDRFLEKIIYDASYYSGDRMIVQLSDTHTFAAVENNTLYIPINTLANQCAAIQTMDFRQQQLKLALSHILALEKLPQNIQQAITELLLIDQIPTNTNGSSLVYKNISYTNKAALFHDHYEHDLFTSKTPLSKDKLVGIILLYQIMEANDNIMPALVSASFHNFTKDMDEQQALDMYLEGMSIATHHNFFQQLVDLGYDTYLPQASSMYALLHSDNPNDLLASFYNTGYLLEYPIALQFYPDQAKLLNNPSLLLNPLRNAYHIMEQLSNAIPYNGYPITYETKCAYESQTSTPQNTTSCPNGYMFYPAWGLAGQTTQILDSALSASIPLLQNHVVPFGFIHELSHSFHSIAQHPQYIFNSTSSEAWANLLLIYSFPQEGAQYSIELGGTIYKSQEELLKFYRPYYAQYKEKNLSFADLDLQSPIVGNLADMYAGIIIDKLEKYTPQQEAQTISTVLTYYNNGADAIRAINYDQPIARLNQFIYLLSMACKRNLAADFRADNFPITEDTEDRINYVLSLPQDENWFHAVINNS